MISKYGALSELNPGQSARVRKLVCAGKLRRRFLDLGLGENTKVACVGRSPSGDPKAFLIRGAVIAIRNRDSREILIEQERPSAHGKTPAPRSVALAGNPNVGKSTVFNGLTGLRQHTGNWPGKTVEQASGSFQTALHTYQLTDTPGAYSLAAHSPEEEITRDFLCFGGAEAVIAVCDATCLERNLNLVLQILELCPKTLVCVNLMDEAEKRGIRISLRTLSRELGVPAVGVSARDRQTLYALTEALDNLTDGHKTSPSVPVTYPAPLEAALKILEPAVQEAASGLFPARWLSLRLLEKDASLTEKLRDYLGFDLEAVPSVHTALEDARAVLQAAELADCKTGAAEPEGKRSGEGEGKEKRGEEEKKVGKEKEECGCGISGSSRLSDVIGESILKRAEEITAASVQADQEAARKTDRILDQIFTSRLSGYPAMILLLILILWLTITGANYPSRLLSELLDGFRGTLDGLFTALGAPGWLQGILLDGAYRVLAWVTAVMLPPMAIFFPLFTFLEDLGYLPRIAYNLDHAFQCCRSCGKQALTLCMSFGCNAVGVTGCRIIDSPRERMIAVLTASFIPCNGRFPALIALIALLGTFLAGTASAGSAAALSPVPALVLTLLILAAVCMALLVSRLLSVTVLRGLPSAFTLELPPYRKPQIGKILIRSLLDRTFFVLGRAVSAAAPAGALIWLLANTRIHGSSLLTLCAGALEPFASLFGLDGVILMGFLLGLPANEIVIPIIISAYLQQGVLTETGSLLSLRGLLAAQGWNIVTALCTLVFMLFHWPCATTLLTIRKETGSWRWTVFAAALPAAVGLGLCFLIAQSAGILMAAPH